MPKVRDWKDYAEDTYTDPQHSPKFWVLRAFQYNKLAKAEPKLIFSLLESGRLTLPKGTDRDAVYFPNFWYFYKGLALVNALELLNSDTSHEGIVDYGLGHDDYYNPVLYFDVDGYGQMSFHIPDLYDEWSGDVHPEIDRTPRYGGAWKGFRNPWNPKEFGFPLAFVLKAVDMYEKGKIPYGVVHDVIVRSGHKVSDFIQPEGR